MGRGQVKNLIKQPCGALSRAAPAPVPVRAGSGVPLLNNRSRLPWQVWKRKAQPIARTAFFCPRRSARYCGAGRAGKYGADTGRGYDGWVSSIAGELDTGLHIEGDLTPVKSNFRQAVEQTTISNASDGFRVNLSSAWGLTHTGSEFAPAHYHQPIALYLGRPAEV